MPMDASTTAILAPLAVLLVLAVVVPAGLCRLSPPQLRGGLALRLALSALILLLLSSGLFAILYSGTGARVAAAARLSPLESLAFFLRLGLLSALAWGPMLVFVGIGEVLRLEKRRSERMMREG